MSTIALEDRSAARVSVGRFSGAHAFMRRLLGIRLVGPSLAVILMLVAFTLFPRQFSLFE